jgi:hypothetical protein
MVAPDVSPGEGRLYTGVVLGGNPFSVFLLQGANGNDSLQIDDAVT